MLLAEKGTAALVPAAAHMGRSANSAPNCLHILGAKHLPAMRALLPDDARMRLR
jgi:hypothetical protein